MRLTYKTSTLKGLKCQVIDNSTIISSSPVGKIAEFKQSVGVYF